MLTHDLKTWWTEGPAVVRHACHHRVGPVMGTRGPLRRVANGPSWIKASLRAESVKGGEDAAVDALHVAGEVLAMLVGHDRLDRRVEASMSRPVVSARCTAIPMCR